MFKLKCSYQELKNHLPRWFFLWQKLPQEFFEESGDAAARAFAARLVLVFTGHEAQAEGHEPR